LLRSGANISVFNGILEVGSFLRQQYSWDSCLR